MIPAYTRAAAWSLALLVAFGILTLWVRDRWAVAAFQLGVFALALLWLWINVFVRGQVRLHAALIPLAFLPLWGSIQLAAGLTVLPWFTVEAVTAWTVTLLACLLLLQALQSSTLSRQLEDALLIFATLIGVIAVLQVFSSSGKAFWLFDTGYNEETLGPFVYRNKYAQFAELVFPLALWRAIESPRRAPLCLTAAAILAAGIFAGASRSGAVFLLIEVAAVLLLAWRRSALSGRTAAFMALQVAVLITLWSYIAGWDLFWHRLTGLDPLEDHRWPIMASSIEIIRRHLFTGTGLGTWPLVYPEFATFDIGVVVNQAHCDWLQWTAEGGLPFIAAIVAFVAMLFRPLLRSVWGVGFLTVLLHATVDYPFHQLPAFATLLFLAAFLAAAQPPGPRRRAAHTSRSQLH